MSAPHAPSLARRERSALVATMRAAGPDAPTLCEGWTTRDLAAHLVVREGRPDAAPGILVPALAARLEDIRLREAERPYDELLDRIDAGAPWYSPLRYADQVANLAEFLVHHEDVRRAGAGWTEREFEVEDLDRIWSVATTMTKGALRKIPARAELRTPPGVRLLKGRTSSAGSKMAPTVVVTAAPVELLLWAFGRGEAHVDFSGDRAAIEEITATTRGI